MWPEDGKEFAPLVPDTLALLYKIFSYHANFLFSRSQFVVTPGSIYFPAALIYAKTMAPLTPTEAPAVIKYFQAIIKRVASIDQYMDGRFNPVVWTHCQGY
jgi:hypothetical protein